MNSTTFEAILRILFPMCGTICTGGALLLLFRPHGNRSQRLLGYIMLFWGIMYTIRAMGVLFGFLDYVEADIISPFVLIAGNFFAIVLLVYPVEVLRPGWLTLRRFGLIIVPYVTVVAIYYAVMALLDQQPQKLYSAKEVMQNIGRFNVWYRFVIVLSVLFYISALLKLVYKYEVNYHSWCNDNYSSTDEMSISWLRYFGAGATAITAAYFLLVFYGETWCIVIHNSTVQIVFAYTLYFGLFHQNPYPEDFFSTTMERDEECCTEAILTLSPKEQQLSSQDLTPENSATSALFETLLPEYIATLTCWFHETRPYLRPDFKLTDLMQILPLNRSYLSRIFNIGMGDNFINVVRNYRMGEARRLLIEQSHLSISEVAERCGFNSSSSFHRTFAQYHNGLTPGQYREQYKTKHDVQFQLHEHENNSQMDSATHLCSHRNKHSSMEL